MDKPIIGLTTGDLNGIGLETIIKIFSDGRMLEYCTPVLFASNKSLNYYRRIVTEHNLNFNSIKSFDAVNPKQFNVFNCWEEVVNINPGILDEVGGKYAIRSLTVAAQCLKDGDIEALVTAPIHKSNTQLPNFHYTGHTPYLKEKFDADDVLMVLFSHNFRVALVTEHIPISKVAEQITANNIERKINLFTKSLIRDFGIDKPKIAVLGLNPHCGDGGLMGSEDAEIIQPLIERLQDDGQLVFGPYSADGFFARRHDLKFDGVLAMYHDQGLIPFKSLAGTAGVNFTAGMSVVRTSPDHGVAFDIAGKNEADPASMREAIFEAINILRKRNDYDHYTADPLKRNTANFNRT